jgi:ubiquinone/menaquinone biosynthesis C-methylase UbiE
LLMWMCIWTAIAFLLLPIGVGPPRENQNAMFADAVGYEHFMGRWSRLIAPRFVEFVRIQDGDWVLDVGSGTGSLAESIVASKPSCRVIGIDPSVQYVSFAESRKKSPNLKFQVGDAQNLSFPAAQFGVTTSLLVLNFIPDANKAMAELRRVTRPGGTIAAAVWDYGEGMQMLRFFWDAAVALDPSAEKLDEKHMPLCRAGELSQLFRNAGLTDVREQPLEVTLRLPSFEDYWNPFLEAQGPAGAYVARLSQEKRSALQKRLRALLLKDSSGDAFSLRARVWAVRGTVPE